MMEMLRAEIKSFLYESKFIRRSNLGNEHKLEKENFKQKN